MYLPHRSAGKVIYTGTHDNDTTVGWFNSAAAEHECRSAECYLGRCQDGIHWGFIRAAQASVADLALVPMQDVLGLGSEARMNTPSMNHGNWGWRLLPRQFNDELIAKLANSQRSQTGYLSRSQFLPKKTSQPDARVPYIC